MSLWLTNELKRSRINPAGADINRITADVTKRKSVLRYANAQKSRPKKKKAMLLVGIVRPGTFQDRVGNQTTKNIAKVAKRLLI